MKPLILIAFIFFNLHSFGQKGGMDYDSLIRAREEQAVGKKFPNFSSVYKGTVFSNKDLEGKTVFINFWFATCPPCMSEMPALNDLYDSLKTKPNFEFISFTYDPQPTIDSVTKLYNIQYKILQIKQQDCYRLNQNSGFPTSIILGASGNIKFLKVGGYTEEAKASKSVFGLFYTRLISEL